MMKFTKHIITFGALLIASNSAVAGGYWGLGVGTASFSLESDHPNISGGPYKLDDGSAVKLLVGSRKGNMGFEIEFSFSEHDWQGISVPATHSTDHLILSGLGYYPLSGTIDLYGKLGLNLWSTDVEFIGVNYEGDDGADIAYGAGISIKATPKFGVRLEYQMMPGLSDGVDEGDVSQFTVNGTIGF